MLAKQLISPRTLYLQPTDTPDQAEARFQDSCLCHLPVTREGSLLGVLSVETLREHRQHVSEISELRKHFDFVRVREDQHLIEVFETVAHYRLTAIPVINQHNRSTGMVETRELLNRLSRAFSFREPGAILLLEVGLRDYKLSEIASVVESEDVKILSLYVDFNQDHTRLYVTMKLNVNEVQSVRANLERFNYRVKIYAGVDEVEDQLKDRYDMLMRYLDI